MKVGGVYMKLLVTAVVIVVVSLLNGPSTGSAQLEVSAVAIDPAIEEALQENPTVPVLISLAAPSDVSLGDATLADVQQNVATRQGRVLSDLNESQFTVTHQYRSISALGGMVTKAGLDAQV